MCQLWLILVKKQEYLASASNFGLWQLSKDDATTSLLSAVARIEPENHH